MLLSRPPMICYNCNQPGHLTRQCLEPRRMKHSTNTVQNVSDGQTVLKVGGISNNNKHNKHATY